MLHKKVNRKSMEFRQIHDAIYTAYNNNALSLTDVQVLIAVLQELQLNPNKTYHVPFAEIRQQDRDGDYVHYD